MDTKEYDFWKALKLCFFKKEESENYYARHNKFNWHAVSRLWGFFLKVLLVGIIIFLIFTSTFFVCYIFYVIIEIVYYLYETDFRLYEIIILLIAILYFILVSICCVILCKSDVRSTVRRERFNEYVDIV